jgi:DNA ligase (NAD+)
MQALRSASLSELQSVEGIGPRTARSVVDWFALPRNQEVIDKLGRAGVRMEAESAPKAPQPLAGLTFVITGTLPTLSREKAQELIEARGGKVTTSVSSKTDYLVLGENPGSKLAKAQSLGIKIIGEDELRGLVD